MVAVPSIGRASQVTPRRAAPEADATRELYERYARQIYSYCLHQLGNREEAEDATQSTFLNAFRGLQRGVDPEFESAWLYKIAQNVCLTRQRSSSRRRRVETPGDLEAMQDYVPAHQADSDELIHLPEALESMPEQQRRALLLREWQGLTYKEIAEELDLSQAAVETLLFRARRTLANGLEEAPPPKKASAAARRLRRSGDAGSLLAILKSIFFAGGTKVAATVATVAASSVVAASPATRHAVEEVVAPTREVPAPVHHVVARHTARAVAEKQVVTHVKGAAASVAVPSSSRRAARPAAVSRPRPITLRRTARMHAPKSARRPVHVRTATVARAAAPVVVAPAPSPAPAAETPARPVQVDPTPVAAMPAPAAPVVDTSKKDDGRRGGGKGRESDHHGGKGHDGEDAPVPVEPAPAAAVPAPAPAPTPAPAPAPAATPSQPTSGSDDGERRHGGNHGDNGARHERAAMVAEQPVPAPLPAPTPTAAPSTTATAAVPAPAPAPDPASDQSDDGDHGHGHHGEGRGK